MGTTALLAALDKALPKRSARTDKMPNSSAPVDSGTGPRRQATTPKAGG